MQIGDPLSPDLVNSVANRIDCYGLRVCALLYGANVAEIHLENWNMNEFYQAGFLILGTSGRTIRTAAQRAASPSIPYQPDGYSPSVLTDVDELTEIVWEEIPEYARTSAAGILNKPLGPVGGARCVIARML